MISLYPDQTEFVNDIRRSWKEHKRIVAMLPTGGGKTRIAAFIIAGYVKHGYRVEFVVPRISLMEQTRKAFEDLGLNDITYHWGDHERNPKALLTISSADTKIRRDKVDYDLVVWDECHRRREQILKWMEEFPEDRYLGLTATPFPNWMGEYFTKLVKGRDMRYLIDNKRLAPYEVFAPDVPDLTGVKKQMTSQGYDYAESDLEKIMGDYKVIGSVVQNWLEHGENRLTMALCVNVAHANHLLVEFQKAGVSAEVVTAKVKVDERERIFQRMREGVTKIILSVECLTEGFDLPEVSCVINARPTKSRQRYVQGMGRALRYLEGKTAIIFDHSGTSIDLGFPEDVTISELGTGGSGESKETERELEERAEKKPKKCPSCGYLKASGVYKCPKCGFKPVMGEDVETDCSRGLKKVNGKKKTFTMEEKKDFYAQLLGWQKHRAAQGKPVSKGRLAHIYREKFSTWPTGMPNTVKSAGPEVLNFIKSRNIAYAKAMAAKEGRR